MYPLGIVLMTATLTGCTISPQFINVPPDYGMVQPLPAPERLPIESPVKASPNHNKTVVKASPSKPKITPTKPKPQVPKPAPPAIAVQSPPEPPIIITPTPCNAVRGPIPPPPAFTDLEVKNPKLVEKRLVEYIKTLKTELEKPLK